MGKVIQTDLEEEEYMLFTELLHKKKLSIREGLRLAVNRMLAEEVKVDPKDPFLNRKPAGRSGLRDLSKKHDEYLYGRKRRPLEGREVVGEESYKKIFQEPDSARKKWR